MEDLHADSDIVCRICYEDDLIEPCIRVCKCDGSMRYIHLTCLHACPDFAKDQCSVCNSPFSVQTERPIRVTRYSFYPPRNPWYDRFECGAAFLLGMISGCTIQYGLAHIF